MKVCVVGFGSIGRRHTQNALRLGAEVFFLRTGNAAADRPKLEDDVPCVFDLATALAEVPDLAVIANPSHLHVDTALKFADAGVAMLVEKPLSHSTRGLGRLEEVLDASSVVCLVGYMMRFDPGIRALKEILDSGDLGRVLSARMEWSTHLPAWHPWEDYRASYAARADMGGGVVLTCSHEVDIARLLFGDVEGVFARGGRKTSLGIEADDCVDALLQHTEGVATSLHLNYAHRPGHRAIRVIGEEGAAEWDFFKRRTERIGPLGQRSPVGEPGPEDVNDVYVAELESVFATIERGAPSPIGYDEGRRTLDVCLALLTSLETGRYQRPGAGG